MPILDYCCCGVLDLRRGTLVIGLFTIVHSIMAIISTIYNLIAGPDQAFAYRKEFAAAHTDEMLYLVLWILLGLSITYLIVCAILIHGVRKEKRQLLIPWIVWSIFQVLFGLFCVVVIFIGGTHRWELVLFAVFLIAFAVIWIYVIIVVISYYQALRGGFEVPPPKIHHPSFWNQYA